MERTVIKHLTNSVGKKIMISGWLHSIRDQGKIKFLLIRDRTGIVQCVYFGKDDAILSRIKELTLESVVEIIGTLVEENQAPLGIEIQIESLEILSKAEPMLPIPVVEKSEGETDLPLRLDYRWIDLRKPRIAKIFELSSAFTSYLREFLQQEEFLELPTPKLMASPSESHAELFKVQFFDQSAYLAQSAQFYKQMAMASGFEKFCTFADTYRMDPSSTVWHVAQFVTLDVEISFIKSDEDVYDFQEKLLKYAIGRLEQEYGDVLKEIFKVEIPKYQEKFPRIPFREVVKILRGLGVKKDKFDEISTQDEREISKWALDKYGSDFLFITDFPVSIRPFYHMRKDAITTRSADLIFKGREVSTDAQREHRYDILLEQVKDKGLEQEKLQHYLDFFRYGCPPHGGFGFGPERLMKQILGLANIREAIMLPRDMKRLKP